MSMCICVHVYIQLFISCFSVINIHFIYSSRSKTIQNDIIMYCGDHIREKVLSEVQKAKYYSILADEVADISNTEQLHELGIG